MDKRVTAHVCCKCSARRGADLARLLHLALEGVDQVAMRAMDCDTVKTDRDRVAYGSSKRLYNVGGLRLGRTQSSGGVAFRPAVPQRILLLPSCRRKPTFRLRPRPDGLLKT